MKMLKKYMARGVEKMIENIFSIMVERSSIRPPICEIASASAAL